jgi:hypothetical protein
VVVPARQQRCPRRRAQGGHVETVVREAHLLNARQVGGTDRSTERVRLAETGVVDEDEEHVGRVLGRLRPGDHRPVGNRLIDGAARRSTEGAVGDGQDGAVGAKLERSLGQGVFEPPDALLVHRGDRPGR